MYFKVVNNFHEFFKEIKLWNIELFNKETYRDSILPFSYIIDKYIFIQITPISSSNIHNLP